MNALMKTILSLSLSGSILTALLLILKPLYRGRLSKKWQYYIWMVVILRFMLPVSFGINMSGGLFHEASAIISEAIPIDAVVGEANTGIMRTQDLILFAITSNLWLVWLSVAVALFVRKITIYQSFVHYVKSGRAEVQDINDLERFGRIVEREHISGTVGLYINSLISSPLMVGFFRPYIVLPTLDMCDAYLRNVLAHELTHYKRGDMFYKWLAQLVICLHWFNPFVHLMSREINSACELSCDEAVVKDLGRDEITVYGDTLMKVLGMGDYKSSVSSITLNENKKLLKERLSLLKNYIKPSKTKRVAEALLGAVLIASSIVVGIEADMPMSGETVQVVDQFGAPVHRNTHFDDPTLATPIVNVSLEDGHTYLWWDVIQEANHHVVYLNGVYTGNSLQEGGADGIAAFSVEFFISSERHNFPVVPGENYIQIRAIGGNGEFYSELSEPVLYVFE